MSRSYIPVTLRRQIEAEARFRCGYCLAEEAITGIPMEVDHIVPESVGGATERDNLWLACTLCNAHKGNRTTARDPLSGHIVPLYNPRRQSWGEHFAWVEDGSEMVGVTAIGRATVDALSLNRSSLVRARLRWAAVGWHPPRERD